MMIQGTPAGRVAPLLLVAATALLAATPAFAEAPPRVRGVAIGVNSDSITVRKQDGSTATLKTGADTAYGLTLTVSYDGRSKSFRITVPAAAPITRFEAADRSAVVIGSSVFIKTNPGNQASLVAVGKDLRPPM